MLYRILEKAVWRSQMTYLRRCMQISKKPYNLGGVGQPLAPGLALRDVGHEKKPKETHTFRGRRHCGPNAVCIHFWMRPIQIVQAPYDRCHLCICVS